MDIQEELAAYNVVVARSPNLQLVAWSDPFRRTWGRTFDNEGAALTEPYLIDDTLLVDDFRQVIQLAPGLQDALVLLNPRKPTPTTDLDVHLALLAFDGTILHSFLPVATTTQNEEDCSFVRLPEGGAVIGYRIGPSSNDNQRRVCLQRVTSDWEVQAPQFVTAQLADRVFVSLLDDASLLVAVRLLPFGSGAFVQRFSAIGVPLGSPVELDAEWEHAAGLPDGRFVIAGTGLNGTERVWIRMYSSTWEPLGERREILITPEFQASSFFDVNFPLGYTEDGTIWIAHENVNFQSGARARLVTSFRPVLRGDTNADYHVDNFDIDSFVLALTDPAAYEAATGIPADVGAILGDCNEDGALNNFDIDAFVELLIGG